MWDARYAGAEYLFGEAPNAFLAREAGRIPPGAEILAVADGEGRNSVFLAGLGHRVTAMDNSPVGLDKARRLAARHGVTVEFVEADIADWPWEPARHDAVAAIFIQFARPSQREEIFAGMARTLRPGGLLLVQGYAPRQVEYGTGGPPARENMYTLELLRDAFAGFDELVAADYDAEIHEGTGHSGRSALIDYVARKPV